MIHPQQNDWRSRYDLSGIWDFQPDPQGVGEQQGWVRGLPQARPMAVPASWNEQYDDLRDYLGWGWYALRLRVPPAWKGRHIHLHFASANYHARVWLNGNPLGEHHGGHLPFELEASAALTWDEELLVVAVENEQRPERVPPGGVADSPANLGGRFPSTMYDFFPYAGLQRPVTLVALPQQRIQAVSVTAGLEGDFGVLKLRIAINDKNLKGTAILKGKNNQTVARFDLAFTGGEALVEERIAGIRPWSPQDPYLYTLSVQLNGGEGVVDEVSLQTGFRSIQVDGDRLLLNGEPIFLRGMCKHEDFPIHGRGLDLPLMVRDYDLLKWTGANSFRTSHYPYSEEAMQMADRLGVLVIDETPAVGLFFDGSREGMQARLGQNRQQLTELIARDRHHPSVVAWSVANEPTPPAWSGKTGRSADEMDKAGTAFLGELIALAHELDPSRPASLAHAMGGALDWMKICDVVMINRYWGWYTQSGQAALGAAMLDQELESLHESLGKPIMVSEFGAEGLPGMHSSPPEMWSEEYQSELIAAYLDVIESKPYMVGAHIWNFADFKTPQSVMRAGGLNHKGVFTRDRRPKLAAHMLRARWTRSARQPRPAGGAGHQPDAAAQPQEGAAALLDGMARKLMEKGWRDDSVIGFDFGTEGKFRLVMQAGRCWVEAGASAPATVVAKLRAEDAEKLLSGKMNPVVAYATGRVHVTGDIDALSVLEVLVK